MAIIRWMAVAAAAVIAILSLTACTRDDDTPMQWTEAQTWDYVRAHKIPYNALHDQNYPSLGCAPCTRAIKPGEDVRAGRWWWENEGAKECGLHVHEDQPQVSMIGSNA